MTKSDPRRVFLGCVLLLGAACDFSGDRSLGVIAPSTSATSTEPVDTGVEATGGASVNPDATGGTTSKTILVLATGGTFATTTSRSTDADAEGFPLHAIPKPVECHSESGDGCDESLEFCAFAGTKCGLDAASKIGSCFARPLDCPSLEDSRVCGCDGQFYPSLCDAHRSGVAATNLGACEPSGCRSDDECTEFAAGCIDVFGMDVMGAKCERGHCVCGGPTIIL